MSHAESSSGTAPLGVHLEAPERLEAAVLEFWKTARIFQKSIERPSPKGDFVFYEGPPTANGMPHNGHVLTRVIKDLFPRYRTMRGYRVDRRAGWDTHGLPVEVEVEKELGIHGKAAIEAYGLEPFAKKCIESVFTYTREWEDLTERVGFWVNTDTAYVTYHRSYVESVWWALSELFKKGLLYKDYKVVWWWAQGGTALSSGEVGEGYQSVDDPSVTIRFTVASTGDQPSSVPLPEAVRAAIAADAVHFLAWTTTPWTLPSNVALAVNATAAYAFTRLENGEVVVTAAELAPEGETLHTCIGTDLRGWTYRPLFSFHLDIPDQAAHLASGRHYVIVTGDHVEVSQTGIVHTAPAFGEDDFELRRKEGLGFLQLIGPDGCFIPGCGPYAGTFCKDADKEIQRDLKDRGLLFRAEQVRHDYPFCPRAPSDPLIQYARPAWFIRTRQNKATALANNATVNWLPETIRDGRFGDFLRNNVDWALSRERYWGTPLNVWVCDTCGAVESMASTAEIIARNPEAFAAMDREGISPDLQVHKPWIDRVTFGCSGCAEHGRSGTMTRVPEVIDCWFDSGCMPFAQVGFPHKGREEFARFFPADFISEAVDQTRGWFYSLIMISTLLFDAETCARHGLDRMSESGFPRPFRNCIVLGHVCDPDGKKESKRHGNYTSPDVVLKGQARLRLLPDASLKPGQLALKPAQVRSLGLDPKERLFGPDRAPFEVVGRAVKGKDTAHIHPDDLARYAGPEGGSRVTEVVFQTPFPAPGADAFRWLFYSQNPPWTNTRLSLKAILEGQREFLFRLKNVHQFYLLHRALPGAVVHTPARPAGQHPLDAWILHALDALVRDTTAGLDAYRIFEPARAINTFVDALSNWWLRRSRERFDAGSGVESSGLDDALEVRHTLRFVLLTVSKVIAPFVPFQAEAMYQSLKAASPDGGEFAESVHLCDWPSPDDDRVAPALADDMDLIRELTNLGRNAREAVGVRVRQPLASAEVVLADPRRAGRLEPLLGLLRDELNVRVVRFSADAGKFVTFNVKPDFKVLGARLGKDMKSVAAAITQMDASELRSALSSGGAVVAGHALTDGDVRVEVAARAGFQAAGSAVAVVALSCALDEDLLEEGLLREVQSRVQALRKSIGCAYDETVSLTITGGDRCDRMLARFLGVLEGETRSRLGPRPERAGVEETLTQDGEALTLWVHRLA
ncbi:MAG: isoleucine--tRNA ligase [Myxococcales bacterium]|nr:isoleucine--tRNA ligase [Myxococcales bacterium]